MNSLSMLINNDGGGQEKSHGRTQKVMRLAIISLLIFFLIVIFIYRPKPLGPAQYPTILLDGTSLGTPLRMAARRTFASGELPGWEPRIFCGALTLYGNLFASNYYPIHLFSYLFPWGKNLVTAAPFYVFWLALFNQMIAFLGMYLLLSYCFTDRPLVSFLGASLYGLTPCVLTMVLGIGPQPPQAFLPWLCLLITHSENRRSISWAFINGLLLGSVWLGSHIQWSFYISVGYLFWWIFCVFTFSHFRIIALLQSLLRLISAFIVAVGVFAIHIIPFVQYYNYHGWPGKLPAAFLTEGAAKWDIFARSLVIFDIFKEISQLENWLFVLDGQITWGGAGAAMILFAILYGLFHKTTRKVGIVLLFTFFIISWLIMLGHRSFIWPVIGRLPGFGSFRYAQRFRFIASFFGVVLASCGLEFSLRDDSKNRLKFFIPLVIALLLAAWAGIYRGLLSTNINVSFFVSALLILALIVLFLFRDRIGKKVFAVLITILFLADLVGLSLMYAQKSRAGSMLVYQRSVKPLLNVDGHPFGPGRTPMVDFLLKQKGHWRYYNENEYWEGSYLLPLTYENIYSIGGFAGNQEDLFTPYANEYIPFRKYISPKLFDLLNVKYIIAKQGSRLEAYFKAENLKTGNFAKVLHDDIRDNNIFVNKNAFARAFLVPKAAVKKDPEIRDLLAMDISSTLILEENPSQEIDEARKLVNLLGGGSEPRVDIIKITNNSAEFNVYVPWNVGYLFYSDSYHPGWSSTVDNRPSKIFKANLAFKAIVVPRGTHSVKLRFYPPGLNLGMGISVATIAAVLFIFIYGVCARRKKSLKDQEA
ncbi:YfhO family protein [Candidatus Omnitrophota bacterium]